MAHRDTAEHDQNAWRGNLTKPSGLPKSLEQNRDPDRIDSGFGDDNSLSYNSGDRSSTDSNSLNDKSRNQVCDSGPSELEGKTAKMTLSDESITTDESGYFELDSRNFSAESVKVNVKDSNEILKPSFMNSFAQSNDIRYLLAALWQCLPTRNEDGDTNLHLAIINCQDKIANGIIDVLPKKEFLDMYNVLIQTPLHLAVITRRPRIVQKLIDRGASVDLRDRNGQTCLHLACQREDIKTIKAIFNPRPDRPEIHEKLEELLQMRNFEGLTPLHIAVSNNNLDVVSELLSLGADPNAFDGKSGHTALHIAVEQNNLCMVSHLLFEGNAYPNALSYSGCTPLHLAAGHGLTSIVATLIAAGANQFLMNAEGDTAFEVASEDVQELNLLDCPEAMED